MEIKRVLDKIDGKLKGLDSFPHITDGGRWINTKDTDWADGFWPGILWLCYRSTKDEKYAKEARRWLAKLEGRKNDKTFDLGFLFYPSFVLGYKLTVEEALRTTALEAADTLCTLFNPKARLICNELEMGVKVVGRSAIDVMMNLPLLWWPYENTRVKKYLEVAYEHSLSTIQNFIRGDFSTIHVVDFDVETGEILRKITVQGYSPDSCWSRGQAWAIYGFTLAYQATKEKIFLKTVRGLTNYFLENTPDDYVPYWDFNDTAIPNTVKDSSAAAIACSGLLTLSGSEEGKRFRSFALQIFDSLSRNYLSEGQDGILKHGCYDKPANVGVDEALIWGDYYFVESLTKILAQK